MIDDHERYRFFNVVTLLAMAFCLCRAVDVVDFFYLVFYYFNSGLNVNVSDFLVNAYKFHFVFLFSALAIASAALTIYFNCKFRTLNGDGISVQDRKGGNFRLLVRLIGDCLFIIFFVVSFMLLYERFFCHVSNLCDAKRDVAMLAEAFFMLLAVVSVLFALSKFRYRNLEINLALHRVPLILYPKVVLLLAIFYFLFLSSLYFLFERGGDGGFDVNNEHVKSSGIFFALMVTALITPFMEEIVFRGYIQGKLQRVFITPWLSVIVVSILFSVMHYKYPVLTLLQLFILSLLLGWVRMKSGSVFPAIFMHMIFNIVGVLSSYYL